MSKHIWSIPCETLLTDQLTNTVSYIQAIEGFFTTQLPINPPPFTVGSLWTRESDEPAIHSRVRLLAPDRSTVAVMENAPVAYGGTIRMRQMTVLEGFTVHMAGTHEILVEQRRGFEWVVECRLPLEISLLSPADFLAVQRQRIAATMSAV
jgi:hypothetical protein